MFNMGVGRETRQQTRDSSGKIMVDGGEVLQLFPSSIRFHFWM